MATHFPGPTEQMWTDTASNFWSKWNFLNCRGDHPLKKTHMTTTAPHKSGSLYPDNKKTSSFVLPALLAAYDHLIIVQVGELSGGSVHTGSKLGKDMQSMVLLHPPCCEVPLPLLMRQFLVKYRPGTEEHFQAPTVQSQNDCPVCHQDSASQMEGDTQVTTTTDETIRESEVVG